MSPFSTHLPPPPDKAVCPDPAMTRGVRLILLATLGIVLMNTCAKMGSVAHSPVEMVFFRCVVALAFLVPYMLLTRPLSIFATVRFRAHLCRALVGNLGVGFVFWAYALLPMADATALLFSAPLFVAALSPFLLKERMDRHRWTAVVIGFGGVLFIVRPSAGIMTDPAALVGLAAALCAALVDMALRNLGRTDDPLTTVFYFLFIGVLVSGPYTILYGTLPRLDLLPWIIGIGIFTAVQQLAKTAAYRHAEASVLAPYTYSAILWAAAIGWLLWHELPTLPVVLGTAVVIGANLFLLWRERC